MNEKTNGESAAPSNGDKPPSFGVPQLIGLPALLVALFFALRPYWPHGLPSGASTATEGIRLEFWVGLGLLFVAVAIRFAVEQGETGLASVSAARSAQLVEKRAKGSKALRQLVAARDRSFMTLRAASLILLTLGIVVSVLFLGSGVFTALRHWFPRTPAADLLGIAHLLAFVLAGGVMLLFGEIVPRSIAAADPERIVLRRAWLLLLVRKLLAAPVALVAWVSGGACRLLRVQAYAPVPAVTEEQLRSLLEASGEQGELEEDERHMLHSVFDFTDTIVREVMTPRTDMDTVSADAGVAELVRVVTESGHSRIPVYRETVDHIIGVVHAKDLLQHLDAGRSVSITELMRHVYLIPESKKLGELLAEMRVTRNQLAIVQDEYGGTSGLVTIEDVVEEIVGEIVDEYDVEEPLWAQVQPGSWVVDGKLNLHDLNEIVGADLESEEFDTIGGLVFGLIGHQPEDGEQAVRDSWQFRVQETDGRRITKVLVTRIPEPEEEETAEEEQRA